MAYDQVEPQTVSSINLLDLPRETRDEIITLVISSRHPMTQTPATINTQVRKFPDETYSVFNSCYLQDYRAHVPNASGLLSVNKQLHSETKDALKRLHLTHEVDLKYDFKYADDLHLALTWTCLPVQTRKFARVHARIQSTGNFQRLERNEKAYGRRPWAYGEFGAPSRYAWIFYNVLRDFLNRGVSTEISEGTTPQTSSPLHISVERLELDFLDPEDVEQFPQFTYHAFHDARDPNVIPLSNDAPNILLPEWLATQLLGRMTDLLSRGYLTAKYAHMYHGRIGTLVFALDGMVLHEFDLGQVLADATFSRAFGDEKEPQRVERWIEWKEEAQRMRRDRGLKTVEFKEGWEEESRRISASDPPRLGLISDCRIPFWPPTSRR